MCLTLDKHSKRTKAEEDIACYKIVTMSLSGCYYTYYQGIRINIGETYDSYLRKYKSDFGSKVEEGLHSFKELKDARYFQSLRSWSFIIKCVIPKGSWYYEGFFGAEKSYASNKLKYIEVVENDL